MPHEVRPAREGLEGPDDLDRDYRGIREHSLLYPGGLQKVEHPIHGLLPSGVIAQPLEEDPQGVRRHGDGGTVGCRRRYWGLSVAVSV